ARTGAEARQRRAPHPRAPRGAPAARLRDRTVDRRAVARDDQLSRHLSLPHPVSSRGPRPHRRTLGGACRPAPAPLLQAHEGRTRDARASARRVGELLRGALARRQIEDRVMNWQRRIAEALRGTGVDADVLEELAQHAAAMYASTRAEGLTADEAERRVDV